MQRAGSFLSTDIATLCLDAVTQIRVMAIRYQLKVTGENECFGGERSNHLF